jgi:hypothetical protein
MDGMRNEDLMEARAIFTLKDPWYLKWWLFMEEQNIRSEDDLMKTARGRKALREMEAIEAEIKTIWAALQKRIGLGTLASVSSTGPGSITLHLFPHISPPTTISAPDPRLDEYKAHEHRESCKCGPKIEYYDAGSVVIHRQLMDGAECPA